MKLIFYKVLLLKFYNAHNLYNYDLHIYIFIYNIYIYYIYNIYI